MATREEMKELEAKKAALAAERQKRIDELSKELEELSLEHIGEHKVVWEIDYVYKDPKRGGDPGTRPKVEYFPDEGKCVFCRMDFREVLDLPPYPADLTVEEKREMNAAIANHEVTFENGFGIPPGHYTLMTKKKIGVVPAGNNPNRRVQNLDGKVLTAAQRDKQQAQIDQLMEKGREAYRREV